MNYLKNEKYWKSLNDLKKNEWLASQKGLYWVGVGSKNQSSRVVHMRHREPVRRILFPETVGRYVLRTVVLQLRTR